MEKIRKMLRCDFEKRSGHFAGADMFLSLYLSFNKFSQTITALDVFTTP